MNNLTTEPLVTKEVIQERLSLPSLDALDNLVKSKRIPAIRLSRKITRFRWSDVETALAKFVTCIP